MKNREMSSKKLSFRQKSLLLIMLMSRIFVILGFIVTFGSMLIIDSENTINAIIILSCGLGTVLLGIICEIFAVVVLMKKNERIKTLFDFNIYDGKSYSNYMNIIEVM